MSTKYVGHWLGSPVNQLPKSMQAACHSCFNIVEHGSDVSVLSEPNIHYVLFFYQRDKSQELLLMALKMCANLHKYLVIIHDGSYSNTITRNSSIFAVIDITESDPVVTTNIVCEKLNLSFSSGHRAVNTTLHQSSNTQQNISKEMVEILRHIDLNLTQEIREEDVAKYCHYSTSYFSKLFKTMVGISFRDYICSKRIALAKRLLLEEPNAKIAFVAYQCGYQDVSYFSRIFKKKTGISPGVFRQLNN